MADDEPVFERPGETEAGDPKNQKWADYTAYHRYHEERAEIEAERPQLGRHKSLRQRRREAARRRF